MKLYALIKTSLCKKEFYDHDVKIYTSKDKALEVLGSEYEKFKEDEDILIHWNIDATGYVIETLYDDEIYCSLKEIEA